MPTPVVLGHETVLGLTSLTAKEGSFMMKAMPNLERSTSNQWPGGRHEPEHCRSNGGVLR